MGTTTTAYAVALGETAPTPPGPVAVLGVTVVLLLLLGAVFWTFLRRAHRDGVAPLAVDRRETATGRGGRSAAFGTTGNGHASSATTGDATSSTGKPDSGTDDDAETAAAIQDEIAEGGPVDGTERS